jgi:hypothetical protein
MARHTELIMKKTNDKLSEIFDVEPLPEPELLPPTIKTVTEIVPVGDEIDVDAAIARSNIKSLIDKGGAAIDNLLLVAQESEHPRAYEVAATFLKTLADMNKDLMDIQKKKNDLKPQMSKSQAINVEKAVFVGSTAELLKQIRESK